MQERRLAALAGPFWEELPHSKIKNCVKNMKDHWNFPDFPLDNTLATNFYLYRNYQVGAVWESLRKLNLQKQVAFSSLEIYSHLYFSMWDNCIFFLERFFPLSLPSDFLYKDSLFCCSFHSWNSCILGTAWWLPGATGWMQVSTPSKGSWTNLPSPNAPRHCTSEWSGQKAPSLLRLFTSLVSH